MWGGDMMGWGWSWFGVVHMVLWWLLIILGIVVLAKWLIGGRSDAPGSAEQRALEILAERYARGEIDKKEFDEKKRDLR
jgi:putative membrane protein